MWGENFKIAENGRIGAHGLNFMIFVNSEVIFEIHDENYLMKKFSWLSDHFEIFVTQPGRSLCIVEVNNYFIRKENLKLI